MKPLLTSFAGSAPADQKALSNPYLRAAQIVASSWTLLGAGLNFWGISIPRDTALHAKLQFLGGGSLLIACAIYSLLIPFYYIHRSQARGDNA